MTYKTNLDLPASVRNQLSDQAQDFYRLAFNSAVQWSGNEVRAHHSAWSAVRSQVFSLNSSIT